MEKTDLVLFNKEKIENILADFDFKIAKGKRYQNIVDKNEEPVKCNTCETILNSKNIGTIAQGSRLVFCDNPLCFATWVAKNKIK